MINSKITKNAAQASTEERVIQLLEGIDWKLWEMYNMMKDNLPQKEEKKVAAKTSKTTAKKASE